MIDAPPHQRINWRWRWEFECTVPRTCLLRLCRHTRMVVAKVLKNTVGLAAVACSCFVFINNARCQKVASTPEGSVRYLTHQTEERRKLLVTGCGQDNEDRLVTQSLTEMGERAVGPLEEALNSIEKYGAKSPFGGQGSVWVLVAYAKVKGPAADARLRNMSRQRKLAALSFGLDSAIALEQSITSHVTSSRSLGESWDCFHPSEPRNALNGLVLAWMRGNRRWFEAMLGPQAKRSLNALLREYTWEELCAAYWKRDPGRHSAIGYQFINAARWGEPWVTLEAERHYEATEGNAGDPGLETLFKTSSGRDCGTMRIKFAAAKRTTEWFPLPGLLVDSPDLSNLLHVVSACAGE